MYSYEFSTCSRKDIAGSLSRLSHSSELFDLATSTKLPQVQKGKLSHRIKEASGTGSRGVDALARLAGWWEGRQKRNLLTSPKLQIFCEELINGCCCIVVSMGLLQTLVPAGRTH